jgi:outer membrane protein
MFIMKRFLSPALFSLMVLLAGAVSSLSAQQQPMRIAYIDVQQIMAQAPGLAQARTAFEGEVQRVQPELQRMATELDSLQAEYQRQQATLTEAARQQRQQELQQRFTTYQQRQQELQQREQELLAPITNRIEEVIEQVRREGGFAMIFDAMQSGIVAADESLDLTNRVLDRLRTGGQ